MLSIDIYDRVLQCDNVKELFSIKTNYPYSTQGMYGHRERMAFNLLQKVSIDFHHSYNILWQICTLLRHNHVRESVSPTILKTNVAFPLFVTVTAQITLIQSHDAGNCCDATNKNSNGKKEGGELCYWAMICSYSLQLCVCVCVLGVFQSFSLHIDIDI